MSSMDEDPAARYWSAVERLDRALAKRITKIRAAEDDGTLTSRQAAGLRISAMESHLAAVQELRERLLGGS